MQLANAPSIRSQPPALLERAAAGKALRTSVPRSSHAKWKLPENRLDPLPLLQASDRGRLPELIAVRYGRMKESPFAFLRGAAVVMAADLATTPTTGLRVQSCGDCHLSNFGGYGTPERNWVFDLNDFDETLPAPWEWDLKRLVTSIVVAGRQIKLSDRQSIAAAEKAACSYREHMQEYGSMSPLEVWYARIEVESLLQVIDSDRDRQRLQQDVNKVRRLTPTLELSKLTEVVGGKRRLIDKPPLIFHARAQDTLESEMLAVFHRYRETLRDDLRVLLDRYQIVDVVIKVVGVGSVGTRCAVALLISDHDTPLFLQIKEVNASVLEPYAGKSGYSHQGQRVVAGQRLVQASSDIFLGWTQSSDQRHFYLRQLRDMKLSIDVEDLSAAGLAGYAHLCGWALARAHARTGDPVTISGYLGKKDVFDRAIAQFALAYADQTEADHAALLAAIAAGDIPAVEE